MTPPSPFPWPLFKTEIALVLLALAVLLLAAFLKDDEENGRKLASAAMAGVALIFTHLLFQWGRFGTALGGSFAQDGLSFCFKAIFLAAAFFTLFMAREYQERLKKGGPEFTLLILFALIGMVFLASASDFLLLFVSLETMTISFYVMTAYLKDENASIEAGVKYVVLGALSTAVFLYGLSFIYGSTGSTSYPQIERRLVSLETTPLSFLFGMILVIAVLGFKIAAVPFHVWAPDVYEGAPTPVAAYLAIGSKAAGFAALVRLMLTIFPPTEKLVLLLSILAALTILYGNLAAIPQTNIKRLLAYSGIGHAGYLLTGLAAFTTSGREAVLYYLLSYLFSTAGAFLVIVAVSRYFKTDEIAEFAGLSTKSPLLAAGMLLSLLSLAGMPPLAGFFAKFYLLWAAVDADLLWLAAIGLLNVITSLYYYLKVVKVMYMDKPDQDAALPVSAGQKAVQYASILGILLLGIYQGPFVRLAEQAFKNS